MSPLPLEEQNGSGIHRREAVKNTGSGIGSGWAAMLLAGATLAAEPVSPDNTPEKADGTKLAINSKRTALTSKLQLLNHQFARSAAVQRIQESRHVEALARLDGARTLYESAEAEFRAGRIDEATKLVDESLRSIVLAAKLVPDTAHLAEQERAQNAEMREEIRAFLPRYESFIARSGRTNSQQSAPFGVDLPQINGMTSQADAFMASGNHHEANLILKKLHQTVISTLNRMLMAQTIVYDLKFESVADEFQYELARNGGFEELIPLALARLNLDRETATMAAHYAQRSRDLRDAAQKQANSGNFSAALKSLQEANTHLQRSLRVSGVVVPQSPENSP